MSLRNKIVNALTALVVFVVISGCATTGMDDCPECNVIERLDIKITGMIEEDHFEQSMQSDASMDLISFRSYGPNAHKLDFRVDFGDGNKLIISIYDEVNERPWELVGHPWNMYPTQELEDKFNYVEIDFQNVEGGTVFSSNHENINLPGILLGVFFVTEYDGVEIFCRIRDMNLLNTSNPDESILVNGTFVGAVDFL